MTSGPDKDIFTNGAGKNITKKRVFKFLDGLKLGNKEIVEEHRQKGGGDDVLR